MPMYSRLTSVATQLGERPTIVFSDDVSSTRQHYIRSTPLKMYQQTQDISESLIDEQLKSYNRSSRVPMLILDKTEHSGTDERPTRILCAT